MGRSKFPGKPSKSLNRKRISVLQLEEEATAKASATSTTSSAASPKTSSTNPEEEDSSGRVSSANSSSTKHKNGNRRRNEDDDDEAGDGYAKSGGGGGTAGGGSSSSTSNEPANNSNSNNHSNTNSKTQNSNGNMNGKSHSANETSDNNEKRSNKRKSKESRKTQNNSSENETPKEKNTNDSQNTPTCNKTESANSKRHNEEISADEPAAAADEDDDDEEEEDEEGEDEADDDEDSEENDQDKTHTESKNRDFKLKNMKKFKNLNLNRPEIMLPSSSKQHRCDLDSSEENTEEKSSEKIIKFSEQSENASDSSNSCNSSLSEKSCSNPAENATPTNISEKGSVTATSSSSTGSTSSKQKKTVTFKNILETSDDKSAVKRFYNPDNRIPLVSIMKKECSSRSSMFSRNSECIVRPSRLTEILKNNSNIDKLNSLKFRSNTNSSNATSDNKRSLDVGDTTTNNSRISTLTAAPSEAKSIFGLSALSRVFGGAPISEDDCDDADEQTNNIAFRRSTDNSSEDNHEEDMDTGDDCDNSNEQEEYKNQKKDEEQSHKDEANNAASGSDDEQQMIVDKHFVLPKRSTRSSRVIKPNKRLVEDGIICKKSAISANSTCKAKPVHPIEKKCDSNLVTKQQNYFGLGNYNGSDVGGIMAKDNVSNANDSTLAFKSASTNMFSFSAIASPTTQVKFGSSGGGLKTNPFILRQPRLQFEAPATAAPIKPTTNSIGKLQSSALSFGLLGSKGFNSNGLNSLTLGNNTNCTVCNYPVHSKNSQQSRKYGVLACEICRKFVSKITKKSIAATASPSLKSPQLQCKTGDGTCTIQPISKSHLKNFKKIFKERCSACWLKKCLLCFQLPPGHKMRLGTVLPSALFKQIQEIKRDKDKILPAQKSPVFGSLSIATTQSTVPSLSPKTSPSSPNALAAASQIKWPLNCSNTLTDSSVKLNLKSNPLAENNVTFGSAPALLKSAASILEKPFFLKSSTASSKSTATDSPTSPSAPTIKIQQNDERKSSTEHSSKKKDKDTNKSRRKDKVKEKDKEQQQRDNKESKNLTTTPTTQPSVATISSTTTSSTSEIPSNSSTPTIKPKAADDSIPAVTCALTVTTSTTNQSAIVTSVTNTSPPISVNSPTSDSTPLSTVSEGTTQKRQRIDLKGPRVKHVCRSASIVLGQPLATFGEDDSEEVNNTEEVLEAEPKAKERGDDDVASNDVEQEAIQPQNVSLDENENCSSSKKSDKTVEESKVEEIQSKQKTISRKLSKDETTELPAPTPVSTKRKSEESIRKTVATKLSSSKKSNEESSSQQQQTNNVLRVSNNNNSSVTTSISKKYMRHYSSNYNNDYNLQQHHWLQKRRDYTAAINGGLFANGKHSMHHQRRLQKFNPKTLISIDFWENYDPAEVSQTGFGLIVTETVAQRALCFLCGSTGLDPLLFCACCCEPYHQYCVMDEYNLKHSSLDDTMNSFMLDTSTTTALANQSDVFNQITNRLNWLCPRCTVCYTCNMSSGSKVKCQKCQKNYHTTCLGTSKRLLGADRPLICVSCLKCKSCATTKVSKFVGNLPLCTPCFRLRKKGNYCPICQKCYDDNDFDLKMMECGDCKQWVHSKCEGLSDEQYNMLSTLPESIEFICKKCARRNDNSKQKAQEWRQTVKEEFKASLLSVVKQLSKSRQACALLKLSPRKKVNCSCGAAKANGLPFYSNVHGGSNGRIQPKNLQFNSERDPLALSDEEMNDETVGSADDVYEFKERNEMLCVMPASQMTSNDKMKVKCTCNSNSMNGSVNTGSSSALNPYYSCVVSNLNLVDIKKKINNNVYSSLAEFNYDMNNIIQKTNSDDLIIAYKEILSEQFPWFQNETKACTDALEEDMYESCSYSLGLAIDDSGAEHADSDALAEYQSGNNGCVANTLDLEANNESQVVDLPEDINDGVIYAFKKREDTRVCLFCRKTGEGSSSEESRLLYSGQDCWVHTNCAMWSAEVFEEIDGSLQNVHSAVSRGRMIKCTVCGNRGATVGCNIKSCGEHYHYPCARSIDCAFLTDKSIYCPEHSKEALLTRVNANVAIETDFDVNRPVYVELDRKRKKLIEPCKVQFHIGSLEVKELGTVIPRFSDSFEAVVPINFLCSRLYWSLKEPWKIVEYTVRTTIQSSQATLTTSDFGRNFTIDHSNPNAAVVQIGLAQISRWHNSLLRGDHADFDHSNSNHSLNGYGVNSAGSNFNGSVNPDDAQQHSTLKQFSKRISDSLLQNQNSLPQTANHNSATAEDTTEEEPQNNADLLPPEIKDAIFEDLPHEILDGISMLDIFPKFMNYEDLGNDVKAELFMGDQSKDGALIGSTCTTNSSASNSTISSNIQISDDDTVNSTFSKQQLDLSSSWSSVNSMASGVNHVEDAMLSSARQASTQIKRALCAVQTKKAIGNGTLQPPHSITVKRRKLSKDLAEGRLLNTLKIKKGAQKIAQEVNISEATTTTISTVTTTTNALGSKAFTWSAAKRYIDSSCISSNLQKDDVSKFKLMQVDGVDDSIMEYRIITTTADSSTQFQNVDTSSNGTLNITTLKCERCQGTYRNYESFQHHLATCESFSISESEPDAAQSSGGAPATINLSNHLNGSNSAPILITAEQLNDLNKFKGSTVNSTSNASTANLPFLQAFQQATAAGIPIGSLQTANINGIPLSSLQGPGANNLQGLTASLQGLQNLQPAAASQAMGGFFLTPTATAVSSANDEVQFFSNALQGLTTNLGGAYTLAPTTAAFTTAGASGTQPQLIAVSTNPDGTQQIIQLPNSTACAQQQLGSTVTAPQLLQNLTVPGTNAYQTLQATTNDKKITTTKPMKTMTTKAAQQAGKGKAKTGAAAKSKTSQANVSGNILSQQPPPITVLNAANNGNAGTQLLSQNLLQQLQASGLLGGTTATQSAAPQILFQTANNAVQSQAGPIIMQQLGAANNNLPQNLISFVTADNSQNPQLQYVTIPTATTDFKPQTAQAAAPFITSNAATNALLQGTAFLQTDASGNLVLTTAQPQAPAGLQMITAAPLNQTGGTPQVIGTLLQPQSLQLAGNMLTTAGGMDGQPQQQVLIGSTGAGGGLEMIAAGTPQVILATQPMYYGLETIVQNTVMSSQQFVSTAMPGVLSQNASFSATTTQVFQASKIEPLVDLPAGYVVLNNVDGTPTIVQQQPQQQQSNVATAQSQPTFLNAGNTITLQTAQVPNQQTHQSNVDTVYTLQQADAQQQGTQNEMTQSALVTPQQPASIVTAKVPPVMSTVRRNTTAKNTTTTGAADVASTMITKVQPQIVNKVPPTNIANQQNKTAVQNKQQQMAKTLTGQQRANAPGTNTISNKQHTQNAAARKSNVIRPIQKPEVKSKLMKTTNANLKQPANAKFAMLKPQQAHAQQSLVGQSYQQPQVQQSQPIKDDQTPTLYLTTLPEDLQNPNNIVVLTPESLQQTSTQFNHLATIADNCVQPTLESPTEPDYQATLEQQTEETSILQADVENAGQATTGHANSNRLQQVNSTNHHVPTNIVNPIQYTASSSSSNHYHHTTTFTNLVSRPTNRVLPMQQRQQQQQQQEKTMNLHGSTEQMNTIGNKNKITKTFDCQQIKVHYEAEVQLKKDADSCIQQQHEQQQQQPQETVYQTYHTQNDMQSVNHLAPTMQFEVAKCDNYDMLHCSNVPDIDQQQQQQQQQMQISVGGYFDSENQKQQQDEEKFLNMNSNYTENNLSDAVQNTEHVAMNDFDFDNKLGDNEMVGEVNNDMADMLEEEPDNNIDDISDADEPAVKEKISRILDNLTNDDCADSIATATTIEVGAMICSPATTNGTSIEQSYQTDAVGEQLEFVETDEMLENEKLNSSDNNQSTENYLEDVANMMVDEVNNDENHAGALNICDKAIFNNDMGEALTTNATPMEISSEELIKQAVPSLKPSILSKINTKTDSRFEEVPNPDEVEKPKCQQTELKTSSIKPPQPPMRDPKKISGPHLLYEIQSEDGFTYKSTSIADVWEKVFESVQVARRAHGLAPLPEGPLADMSGVQMIGLKTNALRYLIEQLPGVERCTKYTPKYHKRKPIAGSGSLTASSSSSNCHSNPASNSFDDSHGIGSSSSGFVDYSSDQEELVENPHECARFEPYSKRSEYDMFSWLASRHRKQPIQVFVQPSDNEIIPRRGTGSNLPMAMKYRTLKETYKDYVGVFRSQIHGRGLYCTKDIEAGEMVIEYAGELIRSTLTDQRERYYNSRGIGCYMFKIDDNLVVDATMRGNAARFINHSCEPNCYSKVVDILGHKHIIIFALRRIVQGEELTYDYKFPFEDEKIPCSCGSKKCRKYLN